MSSSADLVASPSSANTSAIQSSSGYASIPIPTAHYHYTYSRRGSTPLRSVHRKDRVFNPRNGGTWDGEFSDVLGAM